MSGWCNPRAWVRITHKPTGVTAEASGCWTASLHKLKDQAMQVLRARVHARQAGIQRPTEITHDYEFPDDKPWPDDITEFRRRAPASEGERVQCSNDACQFHVARRGELSTICPRSNCGMLILAKGNEL